MPSSSSSNAFARRVRRVSAFPSRTSAIRSARVPGSRKPPRIIPLQESLAPAPASFFVNRWNRGIYGMNVRRIGIAPIHLDYDAIKDCNRWHAPRSPRQRRQNPRPAARALVEAREIVLLVGRMHPVVVEREADHDRVHAEHALEVADDRDRAALPDRYRLLAPLTRERAARLDEVRVIERQLN